MNIYVLFLFPCSTRFTSELKKVGILEIRKLNISRRKSRHFKIFAANIRIFGRVQPKRIKI